MTRKRLPIGIEDFETIVRENYYYVDKTGLIADLLNSGGLITLFTRPRRFGKSLNMSMLKTFFAPESDKSVFEGLQISGEEELCREYMGKCPVISLSLKDICAETFETAYDITADLIRETAASVDEAVAGSNRMRPSDRAALDRLLEREIGESSLYGSLYVLSRILERTSGQKVVILIDEYDVPLAKAWEQGYYDRMVILIRNLFQQALKTNSSLKLAVLTGCMRISKESIFTGLNNLKVLGVADARSDEQFGFTDPEVRKLLSYYGLSEHYKEVKEWYDGYRFGDTNVYCPWDVINYCDCVQYNPGGFPENYWANSSGNEVVRRFVECSSNATLQREIESLVNGEMVEKTIRQELTYQDMYSSIDNIWSVLFTSGYLTQRGRSGNRFLLAIPNQEIRTIYTEQILETFRENVQKDTGMRDSLCDALEEGDASAAEKYLSDFLLRTISVRDTAVRKSMKENFYHGLLIGLLSGRDNWDIISNQESGDGYCDILIRSVISRRGIVIEAKYAANGDLEAACRKGLEQIADKRYAAKLVQEKFTPILNYGVAFYRKECRVLLLVEGE